MGLVLPTLLPDPSSLRPGNLDSNADDRTSGHCRPEGHGTCVRGPVRESVWRDLKRKRTSLFSPIPLSSNRRSRGEKRGSERRSGPNLLCASGSDSDSSFLKPPKTSPSRASKTTPHTPRPETLARRPTSPADAYDPLTTGPSESAGAASTAERGPEQNSSSPLPSPSLRERTDAKHYQGLCGSGGVDREALIVYWLRLPESAAAAQTSTSSPFFRGTERGRGKRWSKARERWVAQVVSEPSGVGGGPRRPPRPTSGPPPCRGPRKGRRRGVGPVVRATSPLSCDGRTKRRETVEGEGGGRKMGRDKSR